MCKKTYILTCSFSHDLCPERTNVKLVASFLEVGGGRLFQNLEKKNEFANLQNPNPGRA